MQFSPGLFTSQVSSSIAQRGRTYRSRVRIMRKQLGYIEAYVFGTHRYTTFIRTVKNEYIDSCTCPYGATCKHTIALSYVIDADPNLKILLENQLQENNQEKQPATLSYPRKTILSKLQQYPEFADIIVSLARKLPDSSPIITPPPQKTLLDVIGALRKQKSDPPIQKVKKEQRVYYVLSIRQYNSWEKEAGKTHLALEVGKAERLLPQHQFTLNDPQDINNMYRRNSAYITPLDRKILSIAANIPRLYYGSTGHWYAILLDDFSVHELLKYLRQTELVFFDDSKGRRKITIDEHPQKLFLELVLDPAGVSLKPTIPGIIQLFDYNPPLALTTDTKLLTLDTTASAKNLKELLTAPPIPPDLINTPQNMMQLIEASQLLPILLPSAWIDQAEKMTPIPIVVINTKEQPWCITLSFSYDGTILSWKSPIQYIPRQHETNPIGVRNHYYEESMANELIRILSKAPPWEIPETEQRSFLTSIVPIIPADWELYIEKDERNTVSRSSLDFHFETTTGIDWLDITGEVKIDDQVLSLHELLTDVFTGEPLVKIHGRYHILPSTIINTLETLSHIKKDTDKQIRLHRTQVGLVSELSEVISESQLNDQWRKTIQAVRNFDGIKSVPLPKAVKGALRPYQQHGVDFLHYLRELGFGGILADDMGLGKTIQALVLLVHSHKQADSPTLIVAPTSVVTNWKEEAVRFAPKLRVHLYIGKNRRLPDVTKVDVIVTSYALLWRDREKLKKQQFHYVILDESQYIKNVDSETAKAARMLIANHRLSLTGTPLENNITELYSQFAFLNPGLFDSLETFKMIYGTPINRDNDAKIRNHLKKLISPFILRRTKEQVLTDLPSKIEQTINLDMDHKQRKLYNTVKAYYQTNILKLVDRQGIKKSQFQILEALLRLRQVCCDPQLLKLSQKQLDLPLPPGLRTSESVKRTETIELLKETLAGGHNILLFSQFTHMLDILLRECQREHLPSLMLTGQTQNRQQLVQQFQLTKEATVFLISLKAGGTGLNLTAADYVVHYDPWWNPAVERQATDRTHRIGQTKTVNVYKLIIKDSVEEKIQALQEKKQHLIDDLITASGTHKHLTREDVAYLLS